jgi:hypothetical protein
MSDLTRSSNSNSDLVLGAIKNGAKEVEIKYSRQVLEYRLGYGPFSIEKYKTETDSLKMTF